MTLYIYLFIGIVFTLMIGGYYKPELFLKREQRCYNGSIPMFSFSAKTAYFPIVLLLLVLFLIFAAFRTINIPDVFGRFGGYDAYIYSLRFDEANLPLMQSLLHQRNEPGYGLFVWIIRKITPEYRIFLLVFYTILFILQIKILSRINITGYTLFSYFSICFISIVISFCLQRNILAMFITWLGYVYLNEKKYIKSFLWFAVASSFHFSAIICYPVWVIYVLSSKNSFSLKKALIYWIVLFVVIYIISMFAVQKIMLFIDSGYNKYFMSELSGLAINTYIGRSYLIILMLWKFKALINHNSMNKIMFLVLLTSLYVIPLQSVLRIMYRMLLISDLAVFFVIPEVISAYPPKRQNYLVSILIRLSLVLYLIYSIISFSTKTFYSYALDNYSNILF